MKNKEITVVGAGLSGLTVSKQLSEMGYDVSLYDESDVVGGRVKSDEVDGFILDHGFQVCLPSYPSAKKFLRNDELNLKPFKAGALIKVGDQKFSCFADPFRNPTKLLNVAFSTCANIKDKLLVLKLKKASMNQNLTAKQRNLSTVEFLKDFGFSSLIIESFFRPFFAGVFLDEDLNLPAHYFLFLFKHFSISNASLPAKGMSEIPAQLAKGATYKMNFGKKVENMSDFVAKPEAVVVKAFRDPNEHSFRSVRTFYFKTTSTKWKSKYLYLRGANKGLVNHVACLSAVSENYAPRGWSLYSVNIVGDDDSTVEEVLLDLETWFGKNEVSQWTLIKDYKIKNALPVENFYGKSSYVEDSVYKCGDYLESPSINGAFESAEKVIQKILD